MTYSDRGLKAVNNNANNRLTPFRRDRVQEYTFRLYLRLAHSCVVHLAAATAARCPRSGDVITSLATTPARHWQPLKIVHLRH